MSRRPAFPYPARAPRGSMAAEELEGPAGGPGREPGMPDKIVRLHRALERHRIPHAFGGAIAVDYYRVPRATIDIDLNLFVPPADLDAVVAALAEEFAIPNTEALEEEVADREQGMTHWGETRIDLFFAASEFHASMKKRARVVDYLGTSIPILSAEDIVTIKAVFDRAQDWADIEAVCKLTGSELDLEYVTGWLSEMIGSDDPRIPRLARLIRAE